jgi:hypothetical protein
VLFKKALKIYIMLSQIYSNSVLIALLLVATTGYWRVRLMIIMFNVEVVGWPTAE